MGLIPTGWIANIANKQGVDNHRGNNPRPLPSGVWTHVSVTKQANI